MSVGRARRLEAGAEAIEVTDRTRHSAGRDIEVLKVDRHICEEGGAFRSGFNDEEPLWKSVLIHILMK